MRDLLVFPYLLGADKAVFPGTEVPRRRLTLQDSAVYDNGVVKLVYGVDR